MTSKTAAEARIAELQAELARLTAATKHDTDRHRQSQRLTVRPGSRRSRGSASPASMPTATTSISTPNRCPV
jgi:hypothetical protein